MHIKSERAFRNKETGHVVTFLELGGREPKANDPVVKIMESPDGSILDAIVLSSEDAANKITSIQGKGQFEDAALPDTEPPAGPVQKPLQRADKSNPKQQKSGKKGGNSVF